MREQRKQTAEALAEEARAKEDRAEALRRRNDPDVKAKRKAAAEAAAAEVAKRAVTEACPGLVVWADRAGETWPSLIQKSLPRKRCLVRYLGPVGGSSADETSGEVDVSSLAKFPGGLPLYQLNENISPPPTEIATKEQKDAHIHDEFFLPVNAEKKGVQLAIDHAVRLCIVHGWKQGVDIANVINGESLDGLGLTKKQRGHERQARMPWLLKHPGQWTSHADTWSSYDRFRVIFNDKAEDADPLCQKLRTACSGIDQWIRSTLKSSGKPPSSTPTAIPAPCAPVAVASQACASTSTRAQPTEGSADAAGISTGSKEATTTSVADPERPKKTSRPISPLQSDPTSADAGDDATMGDHTHPHDGPGGHSKTGEGKEKTKEGTRSSKSPHDLGAGVGGAGITGSSNDADSQLVGTGKGQGTPEPDNEEVAKSKSDSTSEAEAGAAQEDGAADVQSPPGFRARKTGDEPYTTAELVARLNFLSSQSGLTLDAALYDTLIGLRVDADIAKASGEDSVAVERPEVGMDNSGAVPKGKGKRKPPPGGGGKEHIAEASAKDMEKRVASKSVTTTPIVTAKPSNVKRRLELPTEQVEETHGDATPVPLSGGEEGTVLRTAGAASSSAADEPPRQPAAQDQNDRQPTEKDDQTNTHTAAAEDDDGDDDDDDDDFSCGDNGGGDDDVDDPSAGSDCGDGATVSPPRRRLSSRQQGASKPAMERARAKAILGKAKAGNATLRDKIPTSSGSGSGTSFVIPKKNATLAAGGACGGGGVATIPKKPIPKKPVSTPVSNLNAAPSSPDMAAGGTSKSSRPSTSSSSITGDPRGLETGGGSSSTGPTIPPKPMAENRPDAMRGLEENACYLDAIEEECRQKLGTGGAYLGTLSRNRVWEKLRRTSEQSNRLRERKVNIMKALLSPTAKCANGDGSGNDDDDDGDDNSGDDDDDDGGGRGRFGTSLDSGDSSLRIRPPTPPLPARAQPKMSPIFPRVDARPIGECKSSWGGDHHGGRVRVEARVADVRVGSRGRGTSGAGKTPGAPPFLGVGTKYRPPPPSRVVGSPNRQQGHTSLAKHPPRDDPVSRLGGTSAGTSRNHKNREDGKKRGGGDGGGGGLDGGSGGGSSFQGDRKRHDKDKLARKSGDRKQGKGDRDHRERSRKERVRADGSGDKRRRSVSSSVDRGRSNRHEKKAKAKRRSGSREPSSSRAGAGGNKVGKHRSVLGESTRSPTSRKRRRRSSSDDYMEGATSGGTGSPPASHDRETFSPRRAVKYRDVGGRQAVSAPVTVTSPTVLPLRFPAEELRAAPNAGGRAPSPLQPNVEWTPPAGQPPPPQGPPPEDPPPSAHGSSAQARARPSAPPRSQQLPPLPPAETGIPTDRRDGNTQNRRSWTDDDMDLDDDGTPPRSLGRRPVPGRRDATARPEPPPSRHGDSAPFAGPRLPLQPSRPPPTGGLAPPPPVTDLRQQGFLGPIPFTQPLYVHTGATAAAAAPLAAGAAAGPISSPDAAPLAVPPSQLGSQPFSSLGATATRIAAPTGPRAIIGSAGPPRFSPQQLNEAMATIQQATMGDHADAINKAAAMLASRRQNPPPSATPAPHLHVSAPSRLVPVFIAENHRQQRSGSQSLHTGSSRSHDRGDSPGPQQHQYAGPPPPATPYHPW
ncbi:unnamed protein product [Ectocarpus fasciculatus]